MEREFIIGVDDTDNLESRGTGFRVREMVRLMQERRLGEIFMITRHQLWVNPCIPYTSHNSSASVTGKSDSIESLRQFCIQYLGETSAEGSDAGFCLAFMEKIPDLIVEWGRRAKRELLTMEEAYTLAGNHEIFLKGITGEHTGIIGSLAAVGLRKDASDGRILWMPGLRETYGIHSSEELMKKIAIERIVNRSGEFIPLSSRIDLGDWFRPVMAEHLCTLYVEETHHDECEYRVAAKDFIKSKSE
jgi:hypothetical protein